ncbi:hypothetical protein P3342_007277 [Pyrenophora teres f. teres]|nr:hypothetical protein P3342_007277 [Pyrenophora teres f. teres]
MMAKAVWYTKLDVSAAFHKIRIKEGDEWKTAFRTRFGSFEWQVTPFGLTGAPATFQRYINDVLREFLDEFVSAYIDDVIIFTNGSLDEHRQQVLRVMKKLQEAGLQLDIDKCEFEQKRVKKVEAIKAWEPPSTVKGVRGFPDSSGYCIGGELSQLTDDGQWKPVAFYSKKCLPAEANYPIHDKELLAIIRCLEQWRSMLQSVQSFTILSDHKNLEYFMKKQQLTERQMRWALELSRYRFRIIHQAGTKAAVPDALSRRDQDLPKDLTTHD